MAQNKPDEINARMRAAGLECKTIIRRRAGRELLSVLRMMRPASAYAFNASSGLSAANTPASQIIGLPGGDGKVTPTPSSKGDNDSTYGGLLDAYV